MNKPFKQLAFLAMVIVVGIACSSAQSDDVVNPQNKEMTKHSHSTFTKPSAAIYFEFHHSGVTPMGVSDIVSLSVRDEYPGATITYKVLTSEGLSYFGPSEVKMSSAAMTSVNRNVMDLQIQPLSEGAHKITIIAMAQLANGQSIVRSETLPIYTDVQFKPFKKDLVSDKKSPQTPAVSDGIIIMPAEETIRN